MSENFDFDEMDLEESPEINDLLDELNNLPKHMVLFLNMPRYEQAVRAIKVIGKFVLDISPDAIIKAEYDGLTGTSLCVRIIADELSVNKMRPFSAALHLTDSMSVMPLIDGNIEIGFTFENVRIPMPPTK